MSATGLRRGSAVAVVEADPDEAGIPVVYLAPLPHGPLVILRGTAALIWQESLAGPVADLVDRVAARVTGATAQDIRPEVDAFVEDLLARGLVEPVPSDDGQP